MTDLDGPVVITPKMFRDERGFFTERFKLAEWKTLNLSAFEFVQDNFSFSSFGVLRGMHYQLNPGQGKLVTCVQGRIIDVIVDIRTKSPSFGKHLSFDLSADNPKWIWIPPGFAHGFLVVSTEGAGLLYKVDQAYNPATEGSIAWNDPEIGIQWPNSNPLVSDKDKAAQSFAQYKSSKNTF